MVEFLKQIVRSTPTWVWFILFILIVLGRLQTRDRAIKPFAVMIAPIAFLALGASTAFKSPAIGTAWIIAVIGVSRIARKAWRPPAGARFDAAAQRLLIPGSIVPLLLMLTIFLFNYAINVAYAIKPALRTDVLWQWLPPIFLGTLTGAFFGRALGLLALGKSGPRG